ncbi:MAG: P1 family peptidase, partial [Gemmatimonadales bacterium]
VGALENATAGAVEEGSVGAGRGTVAFWWKGGIGTSSRVLPEELGGWTAGVLVQTNFGGILQIQGVPVGKALDRYAFRSVVEGEREKGDGSIMIVVATDAPVLDRNLERMAARAIMGLARTGASGSNGSGDYVIAFSTAGELRRSPGEPAPAAAEVLNDEMSGLFQAVIESTEEAIYNSLFQATAVTSGERTVEPIPLEKVRPLLEEHGIKSPAAR